MSSNNSRDVVIVAAARSAVGKAKKGSLKDTRPDELLTQTLSGLLAQVEGFNAETLGDVVIGCAMPEAEQGMNIARISALAAGIPQSVPAMTINRFCSSGLQSLAQAAACIEAGWYDAALTGGVESMSKVKMGGDRISPNPDIMANHPEIYVPMGITSENVAQQYGISREEQDAFAASSHAKAAAAIDSGKFKDEIIPIKTKVFDGTNWKEIVFAEDEGLRRSTTADGLAKLRPVFSARGTTTAGKAVKEEVDEESMGDWYLTTVSCLRFEWNTAELNWQTRSRHTFRTIVMYSHLIPRFAHTLHREFYINV